MLINQFFLKITLLGVISSFQEIENPQLENIETWRAIALPPDLIRTEI